MENSIFHARSIIRNAWKWKIPFFMPDPLSGMHGNGKSHFSCQIHYQECMEMGNSIFPLDLSLEIADLSLKSRWIITENGIIHFPHSRCWKMDGTVFPARKNGSNPFPVTDVADSATENGIIHFSVTGNGFDPFFRAGKMDPSIFQQRECGKWIIPFSSDKSARKMEYSIFSDKSAISSDKWIQFQ